MYEFRGYNMLQRWEFLLRFAQAAEGLCW
jgi:hypothetical protein